MRTVTVSELAPKFEGESTVHGASADGSPSVLPSHARTVAQVLEWVGRDPARAQLAIDVEYQRAHMRITLLDALERINLGDAR